MVIPSMGACKQNNNEARSMITILKKKTLLTKLALTSILGSSVLSMKAVIIVGHSYHIRFESLVGKLIRTSIVEPISQCINATRFPFHRAIASGDIPELYLLLAEQHNPNEVGVRGLTPLCLAIHLGREEIASILLREGAAVNAGDQWGSSPLQWAANYGSLNLVNLLLKNGATINHADNDGVTPLHEAEAVDDAEIVEILLVKGADANKVNNDGNAPLHFAAMRGRRLKTLEVLLQHGANVHQANHLGKTPLKLAERVAVHTGQMDAVKLLQRASRG